MKKDVDIKKYLAYFCVWVFIMGVEMAYATAYNINFWLYLITLITITSIYLMGAHDFEG